MGAWLAHVPLGGRWVGRRLADLGWLPSCEGIGWFLAAAMGMTESRVRLDQNKKCERP